MRTTAKLYGNFSMRVYEGGHLQWRITKRNQITDDGRRTVLQLLSQDAAGTPEQANPEFAQIWSLSVGSSSIPPTAAQVGLIAPIWTSALVIGSERIYVPVLFELQVHKEIPVGSISTGSILSEAALFTRGAEDSPVLAPTWEAILHRTMYARQIFPSFEMGATMSVVFDWNLGMTVA